MLTTNQITEQIEDYIRYMHSVGVELAHSLYSLRRFGKFTREACYEGPLTWQIVKAFCERDGEKSSLKTKGRRFELISSFGKYAASIFPCSEVLPIQPYGRCHSRPRPHIYTDSEIGNLMKKSRTIYSPDGIRRLTLETAIGLMLTTGIRTIELVSLRIRDFDLDSGIITVRNGKNSKQRLLPLSKSVRNELVSYRNAVERILGTAHHEDEPFFLTTGGRPMTERSLEYAFSRIRDCIDVSDSDYKAALLYHLRHTFACRTIERWLESGEDINSKIYILSNYMGHSHPEDTYWYLSSTDRIMKLASSRYEQLFGGECDD